MPEMRYTASVGAVAALNAVAHCHGGKQRSGGRRGGEGNRSSGKFGTPEIKNISPKT
jgi:hypothetical protein